MEDTMYMYSIRHNKVLPNVRQNSSDVKYLWTNVS